MKRFLSMFLLGVPLALAAQNPVVRDQFTADPTARVFNNKVYLFPSHDITPPEDDPDLQGIFHVVNTRGSGLSLWHDMLDNQTLIGFDR